MCYLRPGNKINLMIKKNEGAILVSNLTVAEYEDGLMKIQTPVIGGTPTTPIYNLGLPQLSN